MDAVKGREIRVQGIEPGGVGTMFGRLFLRAGEGEDGCDPV